MKDAAAHEEEDRKRRDAIETRNKADQLAYGVEKALTEVKDKLPADKVSEVESKVRALREAIDKNEEDNIRTRMDDLQTAMSKIAELAYAAAGGAPTEGAGSTHASPGGSKKRGGDDDVIDAEFEESN